MTSSGMAVAGIGAAVVAGFLLAMLFVSAAFLLWGARIAHIERRSYGRALAATLLGFVVSGILSLVLAFLSVAGTAIALLAGFLVEALVAMPIFDTTYLRALAAVVISWALSILVTIAVAFILAIGFGLMLA